MSNNKKMKTLHLVIISTVGITSLIGIGIYIMFNPITFGIRNSYNATEVRMPTPQLPPITILLNGTGSSQNADPVFELRNGENAIIEVKIRPWLSNANVSTVSITVGTPFGHQMPRGITLKLSPANIMHTTTSLLSISVRNYTIPGRYDFVIDADTDNWGLEQDFTILVIPSTNSSHNPNTVG